MTFDPGQGGLARLTAKEIRAVDEPHNRLARGLVREAILARASVHISGRMLDVGCGLKPYELILKPYVTEHVGLDHPETLHGLSRVDIVGSVYAMPIADETFDSVLCTEVLEHLEEPATALEECHRILRPGGYVVLTVPFMWQLHEEPRDFFRYSNHGLAYLLSRSGFEVVEVSPLGGLWTTIGQFLAYALQGYDRRFVRRTRLVGPATVAVQRAAIRMERRSPRPAWASHFVAVARRPLHI